MIYFDSSCSLPILPERMNAKNLQADYWFNLLITKIPRLNGVIPKHFSFAPLVFLGSILLVLLIVRKVLNIKKSLNEKSILLDLTPPAITEQSAYTTERLFSIINAIASQRNWKEKLLGYNSRFSLEIVSTQNEGIRYLIRTTPDEVNTLRKSLLSYLPQLSIKTVNEYLPDNLEAFAKFHFRILEYKLSHDYAYPLRKHEELVEHDPIAYITGMMTKLAAGEVISLQLVISQTKPRKIKRLNKILFTNGNLVGYIKTPIILRSILFNSFRAPHIKSAAEQEITNLIASKIDQSLFETTIRLLISVKDQVELSERIKGFSSSFATFSGPGHQSIVKVRNLNTDWMKKYLFYAFQKRWAGISNKLILSTSEISDIYHFPFTSTTKTEDLVKVHSRELPAPLSLKKVNKDIIFAKNSYGGKTTEIGLTKEEREKHMYIIGATGAGKTTMILSMIKEDIKNGKGFGVIDPHGDLAENIISLIPEKRKEDFIYINPDDIKYPVGLNLLELTPGLDEDELLREKELITESVISLFRKVFSEVWSAHAHRLEYILRNTIQTALCLKEPTIFTIYELLTDPKFQIEALNQLEDENLKNFWKNEFGKAGDFQKVKMIGPITSRVGRFLFSPSAKRILEQKRSTINFEEVMDQGKMLICNLSKGKLGEDNTEVLGIMILTKIQLTALKRARKPQENRAPFYLYVDEFQTFATPSFVQMLSEARKFKVFLTMAEQSTSQQKDRNLVNVILANVGTVVSFRSANPDDEKVMLPQYSPYVKVGEISNLPSYKFYMKVNAVSPEEPFSGETIPVEIKVDKKRVEGLIELSRKNNAIVYQKPISDKKETEDIKERVSRSAETFRNIDALT